VARRCGLVADRKHSPDGRRAKTLLNQPFGELTRLREERLSEIHAVAHKRRRGSQVCPAAGNSYFTSSAVLGAVPRISCSLHWIWPRVRLSLRKAACSSPTPACFTGNPGPASRATAPCRCGRFPLPCPPSRRSSAPPERAAADPTAAARDCRRPATGHNPCAR